MNFERNMLNGAVSFFKRRGRGATNLHHRHERERERVSEIDNVPKMQAVGLSRPKEFDAFMKSCGVENFKIFDSSSWDEFSRFCELHPEPWNPIMKAWRANRLGHVIPANTRINSRADLERYRTPQRTAKADKVKILREQTINEFLNGGKKE